MVPTMVASAVPHLMVEGDTSITSGMSTLTSIVSSVWTTMTGNPLVMVFVAGSLLGVGIGVIRKLTKGKA